MPRRSTKKRETLSTARGTETMRRSADVAWYNMTQNHTKALGLKWLRFYLFLQILSLFCAFLPMFITPLFIIIQEANSESPGQIIKVTGITYWVNSGTYCFNLLFLNVNRNNCALADLNSFWQSNVSYASFFFLLVYGFGFFCNCLGCLAAFWMIRGYVYGLGNAVCFGAALFYLLGLL